MIHERRRRLQIECDVTGANDGRSQLEWSKKTSPRGTLTLNSADDLNKEICSPLDAATSGRHFSRFFPF